MTEQMLLKNCQLSFYSPFISTTCMSFHATKQILREGTGEAFHILKKVAKCNTLNQKEFLYLFDCLFTDYLTVVRRIDVEMWRAKSFMYGLQDDEKEGKRMLEAICCELQTIFVETSQHSQQ